MQLVHAHVLKTLSSNGIKAISQSKLSWAIITLCFAILYQLIPAEAGASDQIRLVYQASCPRLSGDGQLNSNIPLAGEQEYFEFIGNNGEQATLLVVNQTPEGTRRLELRLFSPDFSELASDTSSFAGADVQMVNEPLLDTGIYTIILRDVDDTDGDFTLNYSIGSTPTPTLTPTPTNTPTNNTD